MGLNDIHSLSHSKWNCKYHVVFAPKYRRKVFYGEKRVAIGKILRQLCEWKGVNIIDSLRSAPRNIVNTRGYIMTALYNASSTYELGLDMEVTRDMFRREASAWEA